MCWSWYTSFKILGLDPPTAYKNFGGNGSSNLKLRSGIIINVDVPWANIFPLSSVT